MEREVLPATKDLQFPATVFILRAILGRDQGEPVFGFFRCTEYSADQQRVGRDLVHLGRVSILDTFTLISAGFAFRLVEDPSGEGISLFIREHDHGAEQEVDFKRLPVEIRRHIASLLSQSVEKRCITGNRDLFRDVRKAVIYSRDLNITPSSVVTGTAELAIDCFLSQLFTSCDSFPSGRDLDQLEELLLFAHEYDLNFDRNALKISAGVILNAQSERIEAHLESDLVRDLSRVVRLLQTCEAAPELRPLQNAVFMLIRNQSEEYFREIEEGQVSGLHRIKRLIRIGDVLGIDTEPLKERLLSI